MTWAPDPGAPLVDGCRVRIGDGPHEGAWTAVVKEYSRYSGMVTLDDGWGINVPLGCPVTVLREVKAEREHDYISTACFHDKHDVCRKVCKFCLTDCGCPCHLVPATPDTDR